jgi:hypothetical protein
MFSDLTPDTRNLKPYCDMIIYDKNLKEGLAEFGIEIPIHHSRAARTFEKLKPETLLRYDYL